MVDKLDQSMNCLGEIEFNYCVEEFLVRLYFLPAINSELFELVPLTSEGLKKMGLKIL